MAKQNNFSGMKFLQVPKVVIYPAAEGSSSSSRTQTYPVVNECTLDPGLLLYIALLCAEDCSNQGYSVVIRWKILVICSKRAASAQNLIILS